MSEERNWASFLDRDMWQASVDAVERGEASLQGENVVIHNKARVVTPEMEEELRNAWREYWLNTGHTEEEVNRFLSGLIIYVLPPRI